MAIKAERIAWFQSQGWIALAGGIGGLASWLLAMSIGRPIHENPFVNFILPVTLGGIAAVVGVFLSNGDIGKTTTLIPALLFGLAWKPVLDAGRDYVLTLVDERQVSESIELLRQDTAALGETSDEDLPIAIGAVERSARELMNGSVTVRNRSLQRAVESSVVDSIAALDVAAERAPEPGAQALGDVGAVAAVTNRPVIAERAAQSLSALPERAIAPTPVAAAEASNSLLLIAEAEDLAGQPVAAEVYRGASRDVYESAETKLIEEEDVTQLRELQERSIVPRLDRPRAPSFNRDAIRRPPGDNPELMRARPPAGRESP